ncbi:unnamed protein product [Boreogadus saida]
MKSYFILRMDASTGAIKPPLKTYRLQHNLFATTYAAQTSSRSPPTPNGDGKNLSHAAFTPKRTKSQFRAGARASSKQEAEPRERFVLPAKNKKTASRLLLKRSPRCRAERSSTSPALQRK